MVRKIAAAVVFEVERGAATGSGPRRELSFYRSAFPPR